VLPLEREDITSRTVNSGISYGTTSKTRGSQKDDPRSRIQIPQPLYRMNEHLSSPIAFSQNTHISANDIATSLLNPLKNSGLTLSPLLLPFDTTAQSQRTIMPGQHTTNANSTFSTMHSNTSTNTSQRDNLISQQPSTQVTFQPPLISDTEFLQLNNDNAITGIPDCYI
jgi:hypothetical protein